jgi:DNA-binding IclR family transcriptional regulator
MDKIVGDQELIEKLQGGTKHVEVFDANGKLLGRYLPQDEYERRMIECGFFPEFDEEIRRQGIEDYKAGRGVTTEELLASLEEIRRTGEPRP